jgi:hypothetical protein
MPMWQNTQAYQTIIICPSQNINAELLLVSGMDYTMRILLYRLVFIVNIEDAKVKLETYIT